MGPEGTVWAQAEVDFWGIESFSTLSDLPEELLEKIDRGQRIAWERLQDTGGSDALPQSLPEGKVDQAFSPGIGNHKIVPRLAPSTPSPRPRRRRKLVPVLPADPFYKEGLGGYIDVYASDGSSARIITMPKEA